MIKDGQMLSIIVPSYKQESTIKEALKNLDDLMKSAGYAYEIIVVVDGRVDNTYKNAKKVKSPHISVVSYKHNHGKGYALRFGMARSRGSIIGFIDGGRDLNPKGLKMLLAHFEWYNADIIVGSKWHPVSIVIYPWWRKVISRVYSTIVKLLFDLKLRDTQLGMKFFKREVLEDVLPRLLVKQFAFDIEILSVAHRLGYTRIYEAPVELIWDKKESVLSSKLVPSIWDMLKDTLAVYYRLKIIKYYDNSNKRKWRYDKDLNFRVNIG